MGNGFDIMLAFVIGAVLSGWAVAFGVSTHPILGSEFLRAQETCLDNSGVDAVYRTMGSLRVRCVNGGVFVLDEPPGTDKGQ